MFQGILTCLFALYCDPHILPKKNYKKGTTTWQFTLYYFLLDKLPGPRRKAGPSDCELIFPICFFFLLWMQHFHVLLGGDAWLNKTKETGLILNMHIC